MCIKTWCLKRLSRSSIAFLASSFKFSQRTTSFLINKPILLFKHWKLWSHFISVSWNLFWISCILLIFSINISYPEIDFRLITWVLFPLISEQLFTGDNTWYFLYSTILLSVLSTLSEGEYISTSKPVKIWNFDRPRNSVIDSHFPREISERLLSNPHWTIMAAGSVLFILETSLQLTPAYSKHWEFRKMICENHGSTCRQEMILEAFNLGFVFGQPFEKFVRSGRTELHISGAIYTCSRSYQRWNKGTWRLFLSQWVFLSCTCVLAPN